MYKYLLILAVAVAALFAVSSCSTNNTDEEYLKEGQEYLEANGKREGVVTTASGLQCGLLRSPLKPFHLTPPSFQYYFF